MDFKTSLAWLWKMLKKHWFRIFAVISIFYAVILPWYLREHLHIPSNNLIYKEVGVLSPKWLNGRDGYLVGIKDNGKTEYFTCVTPGGRRNDCFIPGGFNFLEVHKGKPAEVLWYNERNGLISTYQRLASLKVDGQELVSLKDTEQDLDLQRKGNNGFSFFMLVLMSFIFYIFDKLPDKKKKVK